MNSEIFARVLFFANSAKRHICDVKIRNWGMIYLHQKNGRSISPFREGFIFAIFGISEISRK